MFLEGRVEHCNPTEKFTFCIRQEVFDEPRWKIMIPSVAVILISIVLITYLLSQRQGISQLWRGQMASVVKTGSASVSDVISLISFALTLTALFAGWYSIRLQNVHSSLEARLKATTDGNGILRAQLADRLASSDENYTKELDLHLDWPTHDLRLVSSHLPELKWKYALSGPGVDYLVEMIWLNSPSHLQPSEVKEVAGESHQMQSKLCDFAISSTCTFRATYPNAESTYIPVGNRYVPEGTYLWRVVPLNASLRGAAYGKISDSNLSEQLFSNWSEFGAFCYYKQTPTPSGCDISSEKLLSQYSTESQQEGGKPRFVIVGTSYSDNVNFSWIRNGRRGGHDIDLIRLIIEHCLTIQNNSVSFDAGACLSASEAYRKDSTSLDAIADSGTSVVPSGNLRLTFRNFDRVDQGLDALNKREIDVFIGSLTGAKERERANIRLTQGYYPLKTALLLRPDSPAPSPPTLSNWLRSNRTVGVIEGSTNEWLAKKLSEMPEFDGRLTIVAFPSFASVKEAFAAHHANEGYLLDGVLLDNVLGEELQDANNALRLPEIQLEGTAGWGAYLRRLGSDHEEFVIAVAAAANRDPTITGWSLAGQFSDARKAVKRLFDLDEPPTSLYDSIQEALQSAAVQDVLPCIRARSHVEVNPSGTDLGRLAGDTNFWCELISSDSAKSTDQTIRGAK
jgi:ABC-type amino acid transport substrate-binding protein